MAKFTFTADALESIFALPSLQRLLLSVDLDAAQQKELFGSLLAEATFEQVEQWLKEFAPELLASA